MCEFRTNLKANWTLNEGWHLSDCMADDWRIIGRLRGLEKRPKQAETWREKQNRKRKKKKNRADRELETCKLKPNCRRRKIAAVKKEKEKEKKKKKKER